MPPIRPNQKYFQRKAISRMSIENIKAQLPEYAKDLRLNLSSLVSSAPGEMTPRQLWGALVACAYATRNSRVLTELLEEARPHLDEAAEGAAKAAAAIMAMNNVYYRSLHLMSEPAYRTMPARLRMNVIANPGVDKVDFELWSLAVSAIGGCGMCLDSHEKMLAGHGVGREIIQHALRIAAVVNAVAVVHEVEGSLAPELPA